MLCIAHRGYGGPENTRAAFENALNAGFDGVELDLRLSRDGEPFLFHDDTGKRLLNHKGRMDRLLAEELKQLRFREHSPHEESAEQENIEANSERVPLLEEILDLLREFREVNLEIKETAPRKVERMLQPLMQPSWQIPSHWVVSSFLPTVVEQSKRAGFRTGLLVNGRPSHYYKNLNTELFDQWHLAIESNTPETLEALRHEFSKPIWLFTAHNQEEWSHAEHMQPDGIISEWLPRSNQGLDSTTHHPTS